MIRRRAFSLFNLRYLVSLAVLGATIQGCAVAPQNAYQSDPGFTVENYNTFFVDNASNTTGDVYALINAGLEQVFRAKGLTPASKTEADLSVRYLLRIDRGERLVDEVIPTGKGVFTKHYMEPVNEAKFLVNVVDSESGQVVWKASTTRDISGVKQMPSLESVTEKLTDFFEPFPEK